MKKFPQRPENGKSVLLLEPNYPNKYPPIGLMKLATYHRLQGWNVVFYKGDLTRFVAERLTYRLIEDLLKELPKINWGEWFSVFCEYISKGRETGLQEGIAEWGDFVAAVLTRLKECRDKFKNDDYFKFHEWDRVLVTTLFTFYADITIETIDFAKRLEPAEIQVGGIMASVVPDYIRNKTGIEPSTGILTVQSLFDDNPIGSPIDDLPLDYSILEEVNYKYPAADAFFGHTTRGCPNKCPFCAVPTLEPEYQSFRSLKDKIDYERAMFGEHPNLMLMDNNVFASDHFAEIVEEINDVGFGKGAKVSRSDELQICEERVREGYNPRAYIRKGCLILNEWSARLTKGDREKVGQALADAGAMRDWHGVSNSGFLALCEELRDVWKSHWRPSEKKAIVDFNQGLDSRLALKGNTMELLSKLPVHPVRIAFDHWELRKVYEESIRAAAKVGFRQMSNYILYNFKDTPEELYWRLRLNIALCEELDVPIYSFPMKYHPISDPAFFSNRDFLGAHWCRKYIRFVQLVLNSTMGKIGRGKTFFLKAFGETTADFRELLLMPEYIIRNRLDCEACGETARWREALRRLNAEDACRFKVRLIYNDFRVLDENRESRELRSFLSFYQTPAPSIKKISEAERKKMVAEFDEMWKKRSVRLSEAEISQEVECGKQWRFSLG